MHKKKFTTQIFWPTLVLIYVKYIYESVTYIKCILSKLIKQNESEVETRLENYT